MAKIKKLGVGIVAFEGTEHIKNIAYEFKKFQDTEIIVCLQKKSYKNDIEIDQYDIDEVERCISAGLVDRMIWFDISNKDIASAKHKDKSGTEWPRILECNKRNMILDELEKDGCTQAIILDSDEYYSFEDLQKALKYFNGADDVHVTYCQYINYWQDYKHYLVWDRACYVPFMADIKYRFKYGAALPDFSVDKTRVYNLEDGESFCVFNWDSIKMHHLSWVRLNIDKKIDCWSSGEYYSKEALNFIKDKYKSWKEWENAFVTFRVPLKPICVIKYEKSYISPRYNLFDKC